MTYNSFWVVDVLFECALINVYVWIQNNNYIKSVNYIKIIVDMDHFYNVFMNFLKLESFGGLSFDLSGFKNIFICVWKMNECLWINMRVCNWWLNFHFWVFYELTWFLKNCVAHETLESLSVESRPMYRDCVLQREWDKCYLSHKVANKCKITNVCLKVTYRSWWLTPSWTKAFQECSIFLINLKEEQKERY